MSGRTNDVFYSAGCTFWTDDFARVAVTGSGIPSCPMCGSVGFEMPVKEWYEAAIDHAKRDNDSWYVPFLAWLKGRCYKLHVIARMEFNLRTGKLPPKPVTDTETKEPH